MVRAAPSSHWRSAICSPLRVTIRDPPLIYHLAFRRGRLLAGARERNLPSSTHSPQMAADSAGAAGGAAGDRQANILPIRLASRPSGRLHGRAPCCAFDPRADQEPQRRMVRVRRTARERSEDRRDDGLLDGMIMQSTEIPTRMVTA